MYDIDTNTFKEGLANFLQNEVLPNLSDKERQKQIYLPYEECKSMDQFYKDTIDRLRGINL